MRITTLTELDALPVGSIVIDSDCDVMHKTWDPKTGGDHWSHMGTERPGSVWLPVLLVRVPGRDLVQEAQADAWDVALVFADEFVGNARNYPNPYRNEAP